MSCRYAECDVCVTYVPVEVTEPDGDGDELLGDTVAARGHHLEQDEVRQPAHNETRRCNTTTNDDVIRMYMLLPRWTRNKLGIVQVGAPLKVQKSKRFLSIQTDTNAEISSISVPTNTQRDMYKAQKLLFPQLGTAKNSSCLAENLKKLKCLSKNASGRLQSVETLKESSMLAKLLVSCKNWRGIKTLEKVT